MLSMKFKISVAFTTLIWYYTMLYYVTIPITENTNYNMSFSVENMFPLHMLLDLGQVACSMKVTSEQICVVSGQLNPATIEFYLKLFFTIPNPCVSFAEILLL